MIRASRSIPVTFPKIDSALYSLGGVGEMISSIMSQLHSTPVIMHIHRFILRLVIVCQVELIINKHETYMY